MPSNSLKRRYVLICTGCKGKDVSTWVKNVSTRAKDVCTEAPGCHEQGKITHTDAHVQCSASWLQLMPAHFSPAVRGEKLRLQKSLLQSNLHEKCRVKICFTFAPGFCFSVTVNFVSPAHHSIVPDTKCCLGCYVFVGETYNLSSVITARAF